VLDRFDPRVVPEAALEFVRACRRRAELHLAGGAALSGAHLAHRLSGDLDLFCHDREAMRYLVSDLEAAAREVDGTIRIDRDAGGHVRAKLAFEGVSLEVDVVHEALPDLAPPTMLDGIEVESLEDLRAAKLTCLLSRSEPRDLVDVLFLERAGYRPEDDLALALRKDAGIDPGVLAWLLRSFPVTPLPVMLVPLSSDELRAYRDARAGRFRAIAIE
jgi:predicted nucleotidyltransferase component of viral defense system